MLIYAAPPKKDDSAIVVPVLLIPYRQLRKEAAFATHQLVSHFDVMDRAIANGGKLGKGIAISQTLQPAILHAHQQGFAAASKLSGKKAASGYWSRVAARAQLRANKVNTMMLDSTKNMLEEAEDSDFIFSEARAARAVEYEIAQGFFNGVQAAVVDEPLMKEWITAEDPCNDCIDNEDDGPIPVDMDFSSGDGWPPAHLNCRCSISLTRDN